MNITEFNTRREKIATRLRWAIAGLAALLVSPIIFFVIKGAIGLAVAAVVGLAIVNLAPWVSMKFANYRLRLVKAEAARNPVETLQNVFAERSQKKAVFKTQITAFRAKITGFGEKIEGFKATYPRDAAKFENQLNAMKALLARREAKYKKVKSELENFELVIQRADALWQMGLAAAEMNEAAGAFDGDQMLERIKTETALDSVQDSVNLAFSEMESDLLEGDDLEIADAPLAIENRPSGMVAMSTRPIGHVQHAEQTQTRSAA